MPKKSTSLLLLIAFTMVMGKPFFPLLDYYLNYDYIATVLCINRDKPALKCDGKCHLKKELLEANDPEPVSTPAPRTAWEQLSPAIAASRPSCSLPRTEPDALSFRYFFTVKEFLPVKPTPPPQSAFPTVS
ncbi:MAG: hypothetical protein KDI06_17885 [Calditrichaeota bacterium]|nr:hypothetical protein [Calditrichota bacterium]